MLFILFTVLSYLSHLPLAVLNPMALVLNLHHELQRQRLRPKIMLLKIIYVVFTYLWVHFFALQIWR